MTKSYGFSQFNHSKITLFIFLWVFLGSSKLLLAQSEVRDISDWIKPPATTVLVNGEIFDFTRYQVILDLSGLYVDEISTTNVSPKLSHNPIEKGEVLSIRNHVTLDMFGAIVYKINV